MEGEKAMTPPELLLLEHPIATAAKAAAASGDTVFVFRFIVYLGFLLVAWLRWKIYLQLRPDLDSSGIDL